MSKPKQLTPTINSSADRHFAAALAEHAKFAAAFTTTKKVAAYAGYYFRLAKDVIPHGQWLDYLVSKAQSGGMSVSERSIQRYMAFAEALMDAARKNDAKLDDKAALEAGLKLELQSPKEFTELCRNVGLMRSFGEYDAVAAGIKKSHDVRRNGPREVGFDWSVASIGLDSLTALSRTPASDLPPADKLGELETKLETALETVRTVRATYDLAPTAEPTAAPEKEVA